MLLPVDAETLAYLQFTARSAEQIALVEAYCKEQMLFRTDQTPARFFNDTLELDLGTVEPTVAGPSVRRSSRSAPSEIFLHKSRGRNSGQARFGRNMAIVDLSSGAVVIAAITSCTTLRPLAYAGRGCWRRRPSNWLTREAGQDSLAPFESGDDYLLAAGLTPYLEKLNFHWSATGALLVLQQRSTARCYWAAIKTTI